MRKSPLFPLYERGREKCPLVPLCERGIGEKSMLPYNKNLKQRSRQLRKSMTDAERHLWAKIRMKQLKGYQFYRQKPIGDYIVDFFYPRVKLVIEVDGSQHSSDEMTEYDRIRDEQMRSLGLSVLRFTNTEVLTNIEGIIERIEDEIPLSPPLRKGETGTPTDSKVGKLLPFTKRETPATTHTKVGKLLPLIKGD